MNKEKILNMTLFAVFASFILILGLVPNLGYITIVPGASITIIHIPVLVGIMFLPLAYSVALGGVFGLTSFIASFIYAKSVIDFAFQNPLISVLPRILFAIIAYFIFHALKYLFSKLKHEKVISFITIALFSLLFGFFVSRALESITNWDITAIYIIIGAIILTLLILFYYFLSQEKYKNLMHIPTVFIVSTLFHSALVLLAIAIFKPLAFGTEDVFGVIITVLTTNSLVEALAAFLIGSPIVVALTNLKENKETKI